MDSVTVLVLLLIVALVNAACLFAGVLLGAYVGSRRGPVNPAQDLRGLWRKNDAQEPEPEQEGQPLKEDKRWNPLASLRFPRTTPPPRN